MSTAKSMAAQYKRNKLHSPAAGNFKSSTSNLSSSMQSSNNNNKVGSRLKATSMTNLLADSHQADNNQTGGSRIQRPASRSALDSIHNGMNAKYAQVQSKVYLQNIKPAASGTQVSKIPANARRTTTAAAAGIRPHVPVSSTRGPQQQQVERQTLAAKVKSLQEELEAAASERDELRLELERERADKAEQVQQIKQELQEKLGEHERQNEEYHQKLLEAYELADQNRRAADSVLAESRQRDEEARKRATELEAQLAELREFVAIKEEMTGKMAELREQIREERERYEEQLKSLHQVFENEKISHVDQNSNYFKRVKPNLLQSEESLSGQRPVGAKTTKCRKCRAGSSQLHCSEHDLYGSKLSTRVQDTARSAWRAGKHFASSVITGGAGGLSACRQCTARRRSSSGCSATLGDAMPANQPDGPACAAIPAPELADHTSVVAVAATEQLGGSRAPQSPARCRRASGSPAAVDEQANAASLIRVDENNKLTIVTKFNDEPNNNIHSSGPAGKGAAPSSSASSERSRCESSSSGRGTSSDAGSAASQMGDEESPATRASDLSAAPAAPAGQKRHKRRSSLFKTSKLFSSSQASLHKLKLSLFRAKNAPAAEQPAFDGARARCLELNQAINVASMEGAERVTFEKVGLSAAQVGQGDQAVGSSPTSMLSSSSVEVAERAADEQQQQQQVGVVRAQVALAVGGS